MKNHNAMDHSAMNHPADGGPAPENLTAAPAPTFPVGSKVSLITNHMAGMQGAEATVVGAFATTTYSVNYEPTDGSAPVSDHKWVVHEEFENPGTAPLADGAAVTIHASHMAGMHGAAGTVEASTNETVYMVDYVADGMAMTNHKWVVESEIAPLAAA